MTPFVSKSLFMSLGIAATILAPGVAQAANCDPFLVAPSPAETASNVDFTISMQTLSRTGQATYSFGKVTYRSRLMIGPIPRPALWRTPSGSPAGHLMDLESELLKRPIPGVIKQFQGVDIQMIPGITPRVSVKFIGTGVIVQFNGVCSTGGVIHGTTPTMDFLLFLRRPPVGNPGG